MTIEQSQIQAALEAQIQPLNLNVGQSESAVVVDKSGNLQTITFTRKS